MRLIVGLGNPGDAYRHNRHNLGFMVVEELARRLGLVFGSADSRFAVAERGAGEDRLVLLKPLTFMNRSGRALEAWTGACGVEVTGRPPRPVDEVGSGSGEAGGFAPVGCGSVRPLVICDDLNLPLGSLRLRPSGSSGGQKGLASLIEILGGEEFPRLRLGIAPLEGFVDPAAWPDYVTVDFEAAEREAAAEMVSLAATAVAFWLDHGLEATISRFNRRVRPSPDP